MIERSCENAVGNKEWQTENNTSVLTTSFMPIEKNIALITTIVTGKIFGTPNVANYAIYFFCEVAELNCVNLRAYARNAPAEPQLEFWKKLSKVMMENYLLDDGRVGAFVSVPANGFSLKFFSVI